MNKPGDQHEIKRYRRATFWDYQKGASLFITIAVDREAGHSPAISTASRLPGRCCTGGRAAPGIFGRIVEGKMVLNALGQIVAQALDSITAYNPGVTVFGRVVMPDHVHFNVHLQAGLDVPLKVLGKAITRFKNYTIKQAKLLAGRSPAITAASRLPGCCSTGGPIEISAGQGVDWGNHPTFSEDGRAVPGLHWQQGYHDRLCLSRQFIDSTERYIAYNPLKWQLMYQTPGALAVHEPLDSPRLDVAEYWKGVGNVALLSPAEKMVSLRISRRLSRAQVEAAVARMEKAVDAGYIILSGFISPGEKLVRDRLCARKDARFVRILPSSIPNSRFKPESRYIEAFLENRYLEIARGNEEVEFSRAACLDYNAEIIEIAKAGEGLAVYFTPQGVTRL